jgi:hypothetical protein
MERKAGTKLSRNEGVPGSSPGVGSSSLREPCGLQRRTFSVPVQRALVRLLLLATFVLAALSLSVVAKAKDPFQAVVCGQSRCLTFTEDNPLMARLVASTSFFTLLRAARPAPFYKVTVGGRYGWSYIYVPSRRLVRVTNSGLRGGYWRSAPSSVIRAFRIVGRGLRPFPPSPRWPTR